MIARSMLAVTAITPSTHKVPRGTVPGSSRTGPCSGAVSQRKLDHGHASDRSTSPARRGLRSMYRRTARRCSSSCAWNSP